MISQLENELIHILFTYDDVLSMANGADIDFDIACERAEKWAKYLEDAAADTISEQLYNCIQFDRP